MKNLTLIALLVIVTGCTLTEQPKEPEQIEIDSIRYYPQRTILPKKPMEISSLIIDAKSYLKGQIVYPCIYVTVQPLGTTYKVCNPLHYGYNQILELPIEKITSLTFEADLEEMQSVLIKTIIVNNIKINSIDGWGVKRDKQVTFLRNEKILIHKGGFIKFENK